MLNPKIEARETGKDQYGLFASKPIACGETVWREEQNDSCAFTCLSSENINALPDDERSIFLRYCYQVDVNLFSGYTRIEDVRKDTANYMNHSCDPSCWYEDSMIIARRDIAAGEEITYDYSTDSTDRDWQFICCCGAANCRGTLHRDDWKNLRKVYGTHFSRYIREKLL